MYSYSDIGDVVHYTPVFQTGYGVRRNHFNIRPRLGYGIGSTILNFFRPYLKRGFHEIIDVASKVAGDVMSGKNIKESAIKHSVNKAKELIRNVVVNKRRRMAPPVVSSKPTSETATSTTPTLNDQAGSGKRKKQKLVQTRKKTPKQKLVQHQKKIHKKPQVHYPALKYM